MCWTLFRDALPKTLRIRGRAELFKVPDRTAYKSGVSERVVAITESSGAKRLALLKRGLSSSYRNCVVCPFTLPPGSFRAELTLYKDHWSTSGPPNLAKGRAEKRSVNQSGAGF